MSLTKECPRCHREVPLESRFCNFCGSSFAGTGDHQAVEIPRRYFSGFLISDLEAAVGNRFDVYMDKFQRQKKGFKTFNWSCALFSYDWLFYRQMWGVAPVFFVIQSVLNVILSLSEVLLSNRNAYLALCIIIWFGWFAFCGFSGDVLYWRHVKKMLWERDCFKRAPVYDESLTGELKADGGTLSVGATIGLLLLLLLPEYGVNLIIASLIQLVL